MNSFTLGRCNIHLLNSIHNHFLAIHQLCNYALTSFAFGQNLSREAHHSIFNEELQCNRLMHNSHNILC